MSTTSAGALASYCAPPPNPALTQLFDKKWNNLKEQRGTPHISHTPRPTVQVYSPDSSDAQLAELYALRYQSYCLERQFLCPKDYPSGLERDAEEQRSAHFAARDKDSVVVGTARLVLSRAGKAFPFEKHCPASVDFTPPDSAHTAEVSRLATSRKSARRKNTSHLIETIYRQMYRYSRAHGIRFWYAAMEKPLVRMLSRYGFVFTPIGPMQDYYGPVTPYIADLEALEQRLEFTNPELLRWLRLAN